MKQSEKVILVAKILKLHIKALTNEQAASIASIIVEELEINEYH